jgi:hypothetical protein
MLPNDDSDKNGEKKLVPNRKINAISKVKARVDQAVEVIAKNPQLGVGLPGGGSHRSKGHITSIGQFTAALSDAWSSTAAKKEAEDIESKVGKAREIIASVQDEVAKALSEEQSLRPEVEEGSDESLPKWDE